MGLCERIEIMHGDHPRDSAPAESNTAESVLRFGSIRYPGLPVGPSDPRIRNVDFPRPVIVCHLGVSPSKERPTAVPGNRGRECWARITPYMAEEDPPHSRIHLLLNTPTHEFCTTVLILATRTFSVVEPILQPSACHYFTSSQCSPKFSSLVLHTRNG